MDKIMIFDLLEHVALRLDSTSLTQLSLASHHLNALVTPIIADHKLFRDFRLNFHQALETQLNHLHDHLSESRVLRHLWQTISIQDLVLIFDLFMALPSQLSFTEKAASLQSHFASHTETNRHLIAALLQWRQRQDDPHHIGAGMTDGPIVEQLYLEPIRSATSAGLLPPIFALLSVTEVSPDPALFPLSLLQWMKTNAIADLIADETFLTVLLGVGIRLPSREAIAVLSEDKVRTVFPLLHWLEDADFSLALAHTTIDLVCSGGRQPVLQALWRRPEVRQHFFDRSLRIDPSYWPFLLAVAFHTDPALFRHMVNAPCEPDQPGTLIHRVLQRELEAAFPDTYGQWREIVLNKEAPHPTLGASIDWTEPYLDELFRVATLSTVAQLIGSDADVFVRNFPRGRYAVDARLAALARSDPTAFVGGLHQIWRQRRPQEAYERYLRDYDLFQEGMAAAAAALEAAHLPEAAHEPEAAHDPEAAAFPI